MWGIIRIWGVLGVWGCDVGLGGVLWGGEG